MEIRIRPATEADYEPINRLRRQVNDLHVQGRPDIFKPGFCEELREHLRMYYLSENNAVLVAEADGQAAGFVMVDYIDRPESPYNLARRFYHVAEIGVDAAFRRRGVATALLDYMKEDARRRGFDRIELDAWAFNRNALAFYQAAGFRCYRRFMEMSLRDGAEQREADAAAACVDPAAVHLICGMICSGKSTYARQLAQKKNAVILSSDDLTAALPCDHDASYPVVHDFMLRKAAEIARCGTDVILDWGFWQREHRRATAAFFRKAGIRCRWYYMDTPPETLRRHAEKRNASRGEGEFFVDEGLLSKCLSLFETPEKDEIDVWIASED